MEADLSLFSFILAYLVTGIAGYVPFFEPGVFQLGQHDVHRDLITLSGFSSGGSFAQQFQFSYSSMIAGIASFSHAYYRCGPGSGSESEYDNFCTTIGAASNTSTYDPDQARRDIREYEGRNLIESTLNLRNKRLYLYAGTRSSLFDLDLSLGALRIYEPYIQNIKAIKTRVQDAEQLLPTDNFGAPCTESAENNFYLGNCGFSGALEALEFLIGEGIIKSPPDGFRADPNSLVAFDQTEFFGGVQGEHLMDSIGYIYVPRKCSQRKCFLHFYFHGCLTGRSFNGTGTQHLVHSGFLEVAETNGIILVAPQAVGNQQNTIGCWDTYGLTGPLYATKLGAQVTVVRNMLARILGEDVDNRILPSHPVLSHQQLTPAHLQSQSPLVSHQHQQVPQPQMRSQQRPLFAVSHQNIQRAVKDLHEVIHGRPYGGHYDLNVDFH